MVGLIEKNLDMEKKKGDTSMSVYVLFLLKLLQQTLGCLNLDSQKKKSDDVFPL